MIIIDKTIVSNDLIEKHFACSLDRCKGACCVKGDSGAPLEWEETAILESIYDDVKPYMTEAGKLAVQKYGPWLIDNEGDFVTPLVKGVNECTYAFFENGVAKCSIEHAYAEGKINFRKPVSCHLYPVRITKHETYDAVNYDQWEICNPACRHGNELGVSVFEFVKDALIRKYGQEWYDQLKGAAEFNQENLAV
ncbi:MAG: DUF3109 family protein [Chitinophagales bacterium]